MYLTPPPEAPNLGDTLHFASEASAFVAWQVDFVDEMNALVAAFGPGAPFCSVGGTANARTLTTGANLLSLSAGQRLVFIPPATNTASTTFAVDGLAPVTGKTVTGVNLPADYLRAGVPTFAIFDGTNLVVDRMTEYGSNANGHYWRYADGKQECLHVSSGAAGATLASGSVFRTSSEQTWTFPAAFSSATLKVDAQARDSAMWASARYSSPTAALFQTWSFASQAAPASVELAASGRWY